jgi:ABC-type glycerol-3-phosphate transport system permease component
MPTRFYGDTWYSFECLNCGLFWQLRSLDNFPHLVQPCAGCGEAVEYDARWEEKKLLTPWHECPDCQAVDRLKHTNRTIRTALVFSLIMIVLMTIGVITVSYTTGFETARLRAKVNACTPAEAPP